MAVSLIRKYNHNPQQIMEGFFHSVKCTFPESLAQQTGPYTVVISRGMTLMRYPETVQISLTEPGQVAFRSRYTWGIPIVENGHNHGNVEQLARTLEDSLASKPILCPQCGAEPVGSNPFCTQCGFKYFDLEQREEIPNRAGIARRWMWIRLIIVLALWILFFSIMITVMLNLR